MLETCAAIGAEVFGREKAGQTATAIAHDIDECFGQDLVGDVVTEIDTKGLDIGRAHITTHLAEFAHGDFTPSPIESVSVERVQAFDLPSAAGAFGSIAGSGTLRVRVTYTPRGAAGEPQRTIATKVALDLEYEAPDRTIASEANL
jgi:hypothetical protein